MEEMTKKRSEQKPSKTKSILPAEEPIRNNVRSMRKAMGMTQAELACKVRLTRQDMYAIESNQYLPSTAISLRLARILECKVEDLFCLSPMDETIEAELLGAAPDHDQPLRVKISQVGHRVIARPISQLGDLLNFVMPADGIVTSPLHKKHSRKPPTVQVNLLHARKEIQHQIVIAGCDPSLFLAGEHIRHQHALAGVTNWTMGSTHALNALLQGEVHMAGVHLVDSRTGESNIPYLKQHVRGKDFLGIRFASWVQGLFLRRGNPKHIRSGEDLSKRGIHLVNREVGSGARFLLDSLLKKSGVLSQCVKGYEKEAASHLEVAHLIRDGVADVGVGVESVARYVGLDFIPLREEQYDLILRKDILASHPMIDRLFDAMVSRPFRQELQAIGGYDLSEIGKSLKW